jgi:hypothetical protein
MIDQANVERPKNMYAFKDGHGHNRMLIIKDSHNHLLIKSIHQISKPENFFIYFISGDIN